MKNMPSTNKKIILELIEGISEDDADRVMSQLAPTLLCKSGKNVPPKVAAEIMGVTLPYIYIGLQQGKLPIGCAVDMSGKGRYTYYISPRLLYEYTGVMVTEDMYKR